MKHSHNFVDITGQRFHRMTVLHIIKNPLWPKRTYWKCRCDCGIEKIVDGTKLKGGNTKSCGCHRREACKAARTTHGHTSGGHDSREYRAWLSMKARCLYPGMDSYKFYGGRGITVCARWLHSFENFLEDMGKCPPGLTLERKRSSGNYTPSNCKWADTFEQANNRSNNRPLTFQGKTMNIFQWAREVQLPPQRLWARIDAGWSVERALTEPLRRW